VRHINYAKSKISIGLI